MKSFTEKSLKITALISIISLTLGAKPPLGSSQVAAEDTNQMARPTEKLELAARRAVGGDPAAIDGLTNAVLNMPHFFQIPTPVQSVLAIEVAKAEVRHRQGGHQGISETQLVDLMNRIGKALNVPDYARVTLPQVRAARIDLAITNPTLMGVGLSKAGMKKGDSILTTLSPLQAMHLTLMMMDQKLSNDAFCDPEADLRDLARKHNQEIEELRRQGQIRGNHVLVVSTNPKSEKVRAAVIASSNAMSVEAATKLVTDLLSSVGAK